MACWLAGCGGAPDTAARNRTFYDWSSAGPGNTAAQFEQRYPPLDWAEKQPNPEYIGVTIVRGGVHLSRPKDWTIREASNEPARAYIQYTSPRAYSFGIYERPDSPGDLWRDVLTRYEDDVASVGAKAVGRRVPVATWRGQGRAYSIERKVEAAKRPLISRSREIVLRGENRIVIVQIVHDGEDLSAIDAELARVVGTLEVL
ncbi:MAG TPA: hypothetical protein VK540_19550 [Polyangiaceae bacterium]|jgi:hypothetical protein|nr:hypothetical protein [Polyangiaceae bacterium]